MERKFATLADSAHSLLSSVQKDVDDTTGDARKLIANLNDMTCKPNQQHVQEILANADALVARMSPKLDQMSDQISKLTQNANDVMAKVGPAVDNANATVSNANETITKLREPLQADLAELNKTLEEARGMLVDLRMATRAKDQDFTYTLENVRTITDNLNDLTESLKQRPWSMIRIRQPKDRQVPQAAKTP
jgi:phospholipid/cholesterol/gamma-HCH transport system substrate-binding protein